MLTKSQVRAILDKCEVLQEGHYALPGNLHAAQIVLPMRVLQQPEYASSLAATLGSAFRAQRPQCVIAPAGPGALLGLELARAVRSRFVLAQQVDGRWTLAPGQAVGRGERVVICEDILTDETDVSGLAALVAGSGGQVSGVAVLADRTQAAWPHPWTLESLVRLESPVVPAGRCAQCQDGVPLAHLDALAVLQA
jgi:orotate phosphoribosyltransferase